MKLQLGLLHRDGRPATPDDLAVLLGEFADRPAETCGEVADGSLLMAYRGDRITFEEDSEVQPLQQGLYILTWDGRLDNREDFSICFPITDLRSLPDPVIVLKAYQMFGESIFEKLIGEFALTLWCQRTKSLLFVRSACGARTLYYTLGRDALIWSSDFAHLVRVSGVSLDVNENYVLAYLVSQPDAKDTPLSNVHAVPPNHLVRFEKDQVRETRQLWDPTRIRPLHYRSDQEYEEHCREKIKDAVRVRLRSEYPIFAELSGGLDSSTVVLTADQILRDQNQPADNLQTVSFVYEESRSCDERGFIRTVEEKRGIDSLLIYERDQQITLGLDDPSFTGLPNALHCFPGRYRTITKFMRQHKARVLLTGGGGDHLFWSEPDGTTLIADQLYKGNLFAAHRECRTWSRFANVPYYELLIKRVLPLALGSLRPTKASFKQPELPAWVSPKYRSACVSHVPEFDGYSTWGALPSRRSQVFFLDHMFGSLSSGYFSEYNDIYVSHPYTHRPLVEFCLSVPVSQFIRNGQTRSLMRRATRDLLPPKVSKRVSKGLVDETIFRAVRHEWSCTSDLGHWQVCERAFVTPEQLLNSLREARLGILQLSGALFRVFSLERWLRSLGSVQSANQKPSTYSALSRSKLTAIA